MLWRRFSYVLAGVTVIAAAGFGFPASADTGLPFPDYCLHPHASFACLQFINTTNGPLVFSVDQTTRATLGSGQYQTVDVEVGAHRLGAFAPGDPSKGISRVVEFSSDENKCWEVFLGQSPQYCK